MKKKSGFTLIEVLLALAIIAIAFTALLKATIQDITSTRHIKDKTISHWVATQGVKQVQLGLITVPANQELTEVTTLFEERWYWRVRLSNTPVQSMRRITITVSKNPAGPFGDPLIAFLYTNLRSS